MRTADFPKRPHRLTGFRSYMLRNVVLAASLLSSLVLSGRHANAQNAAASSAPQLLSQQLQRLGASANELMNSIPSFTCNETAFSQETRDGRVSRPVKMAGVVRAIRQPNGVLTEKYEYKHDHMLLIIPKIPPLFVSGGFATALGYFLPSAQACYRYTLSPGRIDFAARPPATAPHRCDERGLQGFALLDASGNVTHIERTLPPETAKQLKLATSAAVDFAPVQLEGHTYQLSQHLVAEMPVGNATGHFEATYTNCHRFAATVTLGASTEVPSDRSPKP